jgi:hypothetical protein
VTSNVQSQGDVSARVFALARSAVAQQPAPPRSVDPVAFVIKAYRGGLRLMLILLAFVVFALVVVSVDRRLSSSERLAFLLFFGAVGLFFLFFPVFAGIRSAGWARSGLVTSADVLEAESAIGRRNKPVVVGRRLVHHPRLGDYEDAFSIGDPWRDAIRTGGRLRVLVSPTRRRTWITLDAGRPDEPSKMG